MRASSNPILIDRLPKLNISTIIKSNKGLIFNLEYAVSFTETSGTLVLQSKAGNAQKIALVSVPSNLGKGVRWYFVCPVTGLRAVNLYWHNGLFVHRKAIDNAYYEKQIESKRERLYRMHTTSFERMNKERDTDKKNKLKQRHEKYYIELLKQILNIK